MRACDVLLAREASSPLGSLLHSDAAALESMSMRLPIVLLLLLCSAPGLARQGDRPASQRFALDLQPAEERVLMRPALELLAEDAARPVGALRFAQPVAVSWTVSDHGTWTTLPDGSALWAMAVDVPGATDLNFALSRFNLPAGASFHVIGADGYYQGPYISSDSRKSAPLWLPVVPGSRAQLELHLPQRDANFELEVMQVGAGYRDLFGRGQKSAAMSKQGSCNIDVICPQADAWRDEVRSVMRFTVNGSGLCTGTLIMDAESSFTPYVLTANHCGIDAGNAASLVFYWNFESPSCQQLGGGSLAQNQSGAIFRAARADVDMALVELVSVPATEFQVYYAGWDRSDQAPPGSVGIHHPNGDEKAISFNSDPLSTINSCIGSGGVSSHWLVNNWESGTTEPGSSGSGLWRSDSKQVVGFLSGGSASCSQTNGSDCYGKFSVAWEGLDHGLRLRDWLDPNGRGSLAVAGSNPPPEVNVLATRVEDSCAHAAADGVAEPGETLDVFVRLRASGALNGVTGVLVSADSAVTVLQGAAQWPDLEANVAAENLSAFRLQLAAGQACPAELALRLDLSANEMPDLSLDLSLAVGLSAIVDAPQAIPDNSAAGLESPLHLDYTGSIADVQVRVEISHPFVGDLKILLRHPSGGEVVLLDRPGIPGSEYGCGDDDLDVIFDDAAAAALEGHCAGTQPWYQGSARPDSPLAALAGLPAAGEWILVVSDLAAGDAGTLLRWELVAPELEQCNSCGGQHPFAPVLLALADQGGVAGDDQALLRDFDVMVRDTQDGSLLRAVAYSGNYHGQLAVVIPGALDGDTLAVLGRDLSQGLARVQIRDAASGGFVTAMALDPTLSYLAMHHLADIDGAGTQALVLISRDASGLFRAQLRGLDGSALGSVKFGRTGEFVASDVVSAGAGSQIGLLLKLPSGAVRATLKSPANLLINTLFYARAFEPVDFAIMPHAYGSGQHAYAVMASDGSKARLSLQDIHRAQRRNLGFGPPGSGGPRNLFLIPAATPLFASLIGSELKWSSADGLSRGKMTLASSGVDWSQAVGTVDVDGQGNPGAVVLGRTNGGVWRTWAKRLNNSFVRSIDY